MVVKRQDEDDDAGIDARWRIGCPAFRRNASTSLSTQSFISISVPAATSRRRSGALIATRQMVDALLPVFILSAGITSNTPSSQPWRLNSPFNSPSSNVKYWRRDVVSTKYRGFQFLRPKGPEPDPFLNNTPVRKISLSVIILGADEEEDIDGCCACGMTIDNDDDDDDDCDRIKGRNLDR
uniref:Uncharacterized protein n=1 Tax=Hyaloperonospora arabidopsidis (strain Emoy2) TaxID=559515 RepID=M4BVQ7_HYAAE